MKKFVALLLMLVLVTSAYASNVTYDGDAKEFIFEPGSEYSPTDLFTDFKDVMPGDVITQRITLRHDSSADTVAKIYMRSRGAHPDSGAFLSKLKLQVHVLDEGSKESLFDNAANHAKPMEDWVWLGTLKPGAEVDLDVILTVPVELDNTYSDLIGYLDWHFMVEEFPADEFVFEDSEEGEEDDSDYPSKDAGGQDPSKDAGGQNPFTGDNAQLWLWLSVMAIALILILILIFAKKKRDSDEKNK